VAALEYAESPLKAEPPLELEMARLIRSYGAAAVVGRVMGLGELRRMSTVETLIDAHAARTRADNWAKWAKDNPGLNRILINAEKLRDG